MKRITSSVIPAGGFGSRVFPATKAVTKALMPVLNKPTIHYILEDLARAKIERVIFVTDPDDTSIRDYLKRDAQIEHYFEKKGKTAIINDFNNFIKQFSFEFIPEGRSLPYGNARPLFTARNLFKNEPFVYQWCDVFYIGKSSVTQEAIEKFNSEEDISAVLTATKVSKSEIPKKGIVKIKEGTTDQIDMIIEKPSLDEAPSNIGTSSPYIFTPQIFDYLMPKQVNKRLGEFVIQDAISLMLSAGHKIKLSLTNNKYMTTGDPLGLLKSTVEEALGRPEMHSKVKKYLQSLNT